ncbi:MAG: hypothetical protein JOZ99_13725 [Actinobacteria bacterium]|nr:hypothetical protein [Actinomycetota bacterium]
MIRETIVCVECGGDARVLRPAEPDDPYSAGDVVAYRCVDCWDRFDVVVTDDDVEEC